MGIGEYLFDHLEYIALATTPIIVYGVIKLKKYKPNDDDLTAKYIKMKKHQDSINKRIKGGTIF